MKTGIEQDVARPSPELSVEDTVAVRARLGKQPQPYELFDRKKSPPKKRTDLRKLSAEIKAQREAAAPPQAIAEPPPPPPARPDVPPSLLETLVALWRKLTRKES